MRTQLSLAASLLALAACLHAPRPQSPPAAPAVPQVASGGADCELSKVAAMLSYFPQTRNGLTMFCRKAADIGTRIQSEKCASPEQMQDIIQRRSQAQQDLQRGRVWGSAACGSPNN
jgi:hypothetical protein